jgi:hypothetical protein
MSGNIRSKGNITILVQLLLAGLTKHYAGQSLMINGVSVAVTDIGTLFQGYLAEIATADAGKTAWQAQLATARAKEPAVEAMVVAVHDVVRGNLGATNPALADFGMKPRAPSKRTSAEKAATAQKALATRAARHTTGPKAKQAIHGTAPLAPAVKPKTE